MTQVQPGPRTRCPTDWGRVVMVPLSALFGSLAVLRLADAADPGSAIPLSQTLPHMASAALTAGFYSLIIIAYMRRGPASATTTDRRAVLAAPVATFLPFALPFLGSGRAPTWVVLVGDALLLLGLAWSLWSLRTLGRSLSVVAQARQLVDRGPYTWVRHPLYSGELVAMLGLALTLGGAWPLAAWGGLILLQAYRAVHEERLLAQALPGYAAYRARTARFVPALF